MTTRAQFLAAMLLYVTAGVAHAESFDIKAYAPSTLQRLYAAPPASRDAIELLPADRLASVEATYTGNQRALSGERRAAFSAWVRNRGFKPSLARAEFPELEFEDAGTRYWVIVSYPTIGYLDEPGLHQGDRIALVAHHVGYAAGRPVVVVLLMGTPEALRHARDGTTPRPRPSPPPPAVIARYGKGELHFQYAGRKYAMPALSLSNPDTGEARKEVSYLERGYESNGNLMYHLTLRFGRKTSATLHLNVPGLGKHELDAGFQFNANLANSKYLRYGRNNFTGCKLVFTQLDAAGAAGKLECPSPPSKDVTAFEFFVSP